MREREREWEWGSEGEGGMEGVCEKSTNGVIDGILEKNLSQILRNSKRTW